MPIRSMTGFAQVRSEPHTGTANQNGQPSYSVSLKSVNHRFLDLQLRLPADCDALEMKLRRLLKEKLSRGHVELTLNIERGATGLLQFNRELVSAYVSAFRAAAKECSVSGEPDLNAVLRMPGALSSAGAIASDSGAAFDAAVLATTEQAIARLNDMRAEEGRGMEQELRHRMKQLAEVTGEISKLRAAVTRAYLEKIQSRMNELLAGKADPDRILQEAATLAERSDIEEEIVRMKTHIDHFLGLLDGGAEIGKKLDFLLQEMNREANTLLSKTAGVSGDGLRITELGLTMKSEIEKSREQIQNIE
jgi:uncharacterized protein (TIGR00255 family)